MNATQILAVSVLLGIAAVAVPLDGLSPAPTAAASMCYISDDPVQDLQCHTRCVYVNPHDIKGTLEPRVCPA